MFKRKIYIFINKNPIFLKFLVLLIILNTVAVVLSSYDNINDKYGKILDFFGFFSIFMFTLEYFLQIWVSDLRYKEGSKFSKRLKFIFSFYGLVDLIAILPFYFHFLLPVDLRSVRLLQLFRVFMSLKLGRISKSLKIVILTVNSVKSELFIIIFADFVIISLLAIFVYYFEHEVQPENFQNIGQALWWAVMTLTTVGYGDIYPVTTMGKILSSVASLIGIGVIALPSTILGYAFMQRIGIMNSFQNYDICQCPKCGNKFKK